MKKKVAIVGVKHPDGIAGGAELFFEGLHKAVLRQGVLADLILEPSDERDFDTIKKSYLRFYDLDLSAYDGVISTKSPSYVIRHSNHVCYLVHTMRVFYDMFDREFPQPGEHMLNSRKFIHELDTTAFKCNRINKIYT
ncbi:MAG: hypothetical protein HQK65_21805, partial [Desulfamplus sp.]|nr:hypothetical protein [Desulfamplus sp.]